MDPTEGGTDRGPVLSHWDLLPVLGLVAILVLCQLLWNRLPDPVPTHFAVDGRPNGWTPRNAVPWLMSGFPSLVWLLLLAVGAWAGPKEPRQVALQRRAMAPMRGFTVLGLFVVMSLMVLIPVHGQGVFLPTMGAFFALLFLGIGLMVRRGYLEATEEERRLWRWGLFYVNAEDARLWVPKRFGAGWTLNFARPLAWVVMGLLCLLPLLLLARPMLLAR